MAATFTPRAGRAGFSLAELVVAMGILGVGMAMAAALFPAGLVGTQDCLNDTTGTIVCHNLEAIAEQYGPALRAAMDGQPDFLMLADESPVGENIILRPAQHYPEGTDPSRTGFVLLGRDRDGDPDTHDGYQLLVIAYRKKFNGNRAVLDIPIPVGAQGPDHSILPGAANNRPWLRNALVIDQATGQYARVVELNGNDALLGSPLDLGAGGFVWVLRELDSLDNVVSSPGIAVLSVWTDFVP